MPLETKVCRGQLHILQVWWSKAGKVVHVLQLVGSLATVHLIATAQA